jgi:hypothetical protein
MTKKRVKRPAVPCCVDSLGHRQNAGRAKYNTHTDTRITRNGFVCAISC